MRIDRRSTLLAAAFSVIVLCSGLSLARVLEHGLMPARLLCCPDLMLLASQYRPGWLTPLLLGGLLASGIVRLALRLGKTREFLAQLEVVSASDVPAGLKSTLCTMGLSSHTRVVASSIPLAFCTGMLRPKIYISTGLASLVSHPELAAVLWHEELHRRRDHPLWLFLVDAVSHVLFFLPVAAEISRNLMLSSELAADAYAIKRSSRAALAGALHALLTASPPQALPIRLAGLSATSARITALLDRQSPFFSLSARSVLISSVSLMVMCLLVL